MIFFFQAEDGIRDYKVTGVQTCALPISHCVSEPASEGLCAPYSPRGTFPASLYSNNLPADTTARSRGPARGRSQRSAAGAPRLVAEPAQLGYQAVSMLALNLDDTLSDATARAAQLLQPSRQLGELRFLEGQSADQDRK